MYTFCTEENSVSLGKQKRCQWQQISVAHLELNKLRTAAFQLEYLYEKNIDDSQKPNESFGSALRNFKYFCWKILSFVSSCS